jgi:hypothetical protein
LSPRSKRSGAALLFAVALLALLAVHTAAPATTVTREPPARHETSAEVPAAPTEPTAPLEYASDGLPIHPRGAVAAPANTAVHPHGFTAAHARIYRENNLVGQLDGAMDVEDVDGMRRLLEQYRHEYPEDSHEMQTGYALIADCLEYPGDPAKRAAAKSYYDTEIASGLRRYIRRHCLERNN